MDYSMNYKEAKEMLERPTTRNGRRKLANNTYLEWRGDNIAIRLHATDIITLTPKFMVLNTGGWYTVTTKDRLDYAPVRVGQTKGIWYVYERQDGSFNWDNPIPYFDGIKISYAGKVLNPPAKSKGEKAEREAAVMKKRINKYVTGFMLDAQENGIHPSAGDCFFCQGLVTEYATGDVSDDPDHLLSHMDESYYVGTLAWNALVEDGYRYPEFILNHSPDGVRRSLRKYLTKRLVKVAVKA